MVAEQHTHVTAQVDANVYHSVAFLTAADGIIIPDPCTQSNSIHLVIQCGNVS